MKLQSRMITLGIALLFAMAFALTVSLAFAATVEMPQEEMENLILPDVPAIGGTTTSPQSQNPAAPMGMLDFRSNGNGTCAVSGLGTYTSSAVVIPECAPSGDRVIAVDPQAFYGEATITSVQIPATVGMVGNLAFAECPSLNYISVSEHNTAYRSVDGVLYSADMSVLILYPPARAGEALTIYAGTTVIREMAFYRCSYLKLIQYTGSPSQWEKISIGTKNYALLALAKEFGG